MPTNFSRRHIGPSAAEAESMLKTLGFQTLDALIDQVVPEGIRMREALNLTPPLSEEQALRRMRQIMGRNKVLRSFIGLGYHDTFTPPVIQRNILENPGWYTAYTPYQAEIAQGRLEALINFQTMIRDLTALDVANASLLDEGTACAEALSLAVAQIAGSSRVFVSDKCHPHNIEVVRTRMEALGIRVEVGDVLKWKHDGTKGLAAVLVQYPDTQGVIHDFSELANEAHEAGALFVVSADLLALTVLRPPGEFGADICVGNSQRFGVPLGFGGPHAAFMAVKDALKRRLPGRLIGVSKDASGKPAYRLSLQTREQHIRREKATSNICTAQVLLAVMASMYAVYHGPQGLKAIAHRVHGAAVWLAGELLRAGLDVLSDDFFDTVSVRVPNADDLLKRALLFGINLRKIDATTVGVALDERVREDELFNLLTAFGISKAQPPVLDDTQPLHCSAQHHRSSEFLTHPVFNSYHSETEMMRYLHRLESKDIALNRSMIPLGSCTMKLNAAAEMMPLSWPEVNGLHPFCPHDQSEGYRTMFGDLEAWLAECTGFDAVSLQPNAGSQGEYAGLLAIKRFHASRGEDHRDICLIPTSAHGTNPASAVMCGFKVVPVLCDDHGNIAVDDLKAKMEANKDKVAALMVTYPSTHGVFEESIVEICRLVHDHGGQVYMDGANMNAQVGLTSPGRIGADVCHLNLHKTFCIPHGGGGPGVGPIAVAAHLRPHLPGHHTWRPDRREGTVCSAPWGSASICTISWMYIAMMGPRLVDATKFAILNANYVAKKLETNFPTLYKGAKGLVAHECILDFSHFHRVSVEDVAKRLMDFGYHAPTMSWPVAGTLMIEPTESESLAELDRFCDAMQCIHAEMIGVESSQYHPTDNTLKQAPHTAAFVMKSDWPHAYTREVAAFPLPWVQEDKYWPPVSRIDNVYGDRHLVCTCVSVEEAAAS